MKKCVICGREFETNHHNKFTCSAECAKEHKRRYSIARREEFKKTELAFEVSDVDKLIAQKNKAAGKNQAFCHTCGKDFIPNYPSEKYCSDQCREKSPLFRLFSYFPEIFTKYFGKLVGVLENEEMRAMRL